LSITAPRGLSRRQRFVAGVRPEEVELVDTPDESAVPARVVAEEMLGDEVIYVVESGGHDVRVRMPTSSGFRPEQPVGLRHVGGPPPVYDPVSEELVA
jgi:sn-glycerol 3-phosphate transport system ATP-binding protein/multiple sugar transport system ATP-binding protein